MVNSYIFYKVANDLFFFFAKSYVFYELPIRVILYEWPTPNPAPKPTRHWGLDKSYKNHSSEVVRIRTN